MNGGVLSVENQRIKWVALGTLLFSVPFIYEFNIHPFFGYLTAVLVSWIIVEDFYDMMIDLRISGLLLLVVLTWSKLKGSDYLFHAVVTFLCFTLGFYILRLLFVSFETKKPSFEGDDKNIDYVDSLQAGTDVGLMPIMGLATFLVLMVDMVFNPLQNLPDLAAEGNIFAGSIVNIHLSADKVAYILYHDFNLFAWIIGGMLAVLMLLIWRIRIKIRENKLPLYPCGAGDPLVIGIFAAMVGAECFYFTVMLLTLVFGIVVHGYHHYKNKGWRY